MSLEKRLIEVATSDELKPLHTPNQDGYLSDSERYLLLGQTNRECLVSLDLQDKVHELYWIKSSNAFALRGNVKHPSKFFVVEYDKSNVPTTDGIFYKDNLWLTNKRKKESFSNPYSTEKGFLTGMCYFGLGVGLAALTFPLHQSFFVPLAITSILSTPEIIMGIRAYRKQKELISFYNGLAAGNRR